MWSHEQFRGFTALELIGFFLWICLGIGLALPSAIAAQILPPNQAWVARYSGPVSGYDVAQKIVTDASGNVYVTGFSSNDHLSSYDYATVKYDPNGNELWVAKYDNGNQDQAVALSVDASGNVYVTGTSVTAGALVYPTDYATVKYDSNGNQLWVARYDNGAGDIARGISVDGSGNVYVTGYSDNIKCCGDSSRDYATVKYDPNGNQLWVASYRNGPNNIPVALAVDGSGNVYVTGESCNPGACLDVDYATIKYDPNGNQLWVARYDSGVGDSATALSVDVSGNVYVTGYIGDYITVKYDSNGNQLWVARYDGGSIDIAIALALDPSGNVYVTGYSDNGANADYATVKYDSNGNQLWVARYDNGGFDYPFALAVDGSGNVYVTGSSDPFPSGTIPPDYATVKYDPNGNQLWVARHDNGSHDTPFALAVDGSGNVYVTGASVDFTSSFDYVTVKYTPNNTPVGSNVSVPLYSGTTATFSNVSSQGDTTVITSSSGPSLPSGFLLGDPAVYYDVRTTATYTSPVTVCIATWGPESIRLFHYENNAWVDVTTSHDLENHVICGQVSSLSIFVIAQFDYNFIGFLDPINNDGSSIFRIGDTVPIKFQLTNSNGVTITTATATLTVFKITDAVLGTVDEVVLSSSDDFNTDNLFRYDKDKYIYKLKTTGYTQGTYRLQVTLDDGTLHTVNISLRAK